MIFKSSCLNYSNTNYSELQIAYEVPSISYYITIVLPKPSKYYTNFEGYCSVLISSFRNFLR